MKKLILALCLLLPLPTLADTIQLTWLHPTERVDNTPLLPEEIDHYQLVIDGTVVNNNINGTLNSVIFDLDIPGSYAMTIRAVDTDGRTSTDALPMVYHEVVIKDPKPATGLVKKVLN